MADGEATRKSSRTLSLEGATHSQTGSTYAARLAAERSTYEDCHIVHNLPDIFHYWSNCHVRPRLESLGLSSPNDLFRKYVDEQSGANPSSPLRLLSIGSGNCDLEINLASHLRSNGKADFTIDCLDMNSTMLERGREAASAQELVGCFNFVPADLNHWAPSDEYDAVIANQTLHHVLELENLVAKIKSCLKPKGSFIVSDIIGRNGHQRWPEALRIVHEFWRRLPPSYRFNRLLQRYEELYDNWDCSAVGFEGIRSQDILPLLVEHFQFKFFFAFANIIDPFVDRAFGPNFDASAPWDQDFIRQLHQRDEQEILSGRIKPTHLLAVMSKDPVGDMIFCEPLTPRFCLRDTSLISMAGGCQSSDTSRPDAYDWHSWPHNPRTELEIACGRLARAPEELKTRTAWALQLERELEERTTWAVQLDKEVAELTAWGQQLCQLVEERTAWALKVNEELQQMNAQTVHLSEELEDANRLMEERTGWALGLEREVKVLRKQRLELSQDLERIAWARPLDKLFHAPLYSAYRAARWLRNRLRNPRSQSTT